MAEDTSALEKAAELFENAEDAAELMKNALSKWPGVTDAEGVDEERAGALFEQLEEDDD